MPISSSQERIIKDKLSHHITSTRCQFCNGNQWSIHNEIVGLPIFDSEHKMIIEGSLVPMVIVFCNECGHSNYFNAMKLDLI